MSRYLKKGKSESDIKNTDADIRKTVEKIIRDVEENGDLAVRQYAASFDNWSPASFRLYGRRDQGDRGTHAAAREGRHSGLRSSRSVFFAEQQLASYFGY